MSSQRLRLCLLANLNSHVLDYVARQKIGGVTLNFFLVEQFPIFSPDRYAERCPWNKRQTLEKWISDRVLKLSCTADDLRPLGEAAGFDPPVHKWNPRERAELMDELDAAFFLLYGIDRERRGVHSRHLQRHGPRHWQCQWHARAGRPFRRRGRGVGGLRSAGNG